MSVKDLNVLVCEDNKINQKVIAQQLRRLGVNSVHVADDGLVALNFLATTTFFPSSPSAVPLSIILMDVEMPVMDGLAAVRRIRQLESRGDLTTHVPVIAITANARPEQVAVALEAEQAREENCPSKACALSDDAHASGVNTAYENARNMMDNAENMATKSKTAFDQISVNLRG
ncbi:hypothetical protein KCU73_g11768, partial [Aureobasidium melanogenum]